MKTKDIASQYSVDLNNFDNFLIRNKLEYKSGFSSLIVDDSKVEEYISLYRAEMNQKGISVDETEPGNNLKNNTVNESLIDSWEHPSTFSIASGEDLPYVVIQVTLKEKFIGTGSANLSDLEKVINNQVARGYRLHTMSTSISGSTGLAGGDRIQATLVFERMDMRS